MDTATFALNAFKQAPAIRHRPRDRTGRRLGRLTGDFDRMTFRPQPGGIARQPLPGELPELVAKVEAALGVGLAGCELIERIAAADPDTVWVFDCGGRAAGGFALLFLTGEGVARMQDGRLNMRAPDFACLARAGQPPAGVYMWALLARGRAAAALPQVLALLQGPRFRNADLWAAPVTRDGERFVGNLGFIRARGVALPNLWRYERRAQGPAA
jgi:hypothetical protein